MTEQLSACARARPQRKAWPQLKARAPELQTILDSLSAGVIVLDASRAAVDTVNPSATRILRQPLRPTSLGQPAAARGAGPGRLLGRAATQRALRTSPEPMASSDHWQDAFELQLGAGHGLGQVTARPLTLLLRGASLPGEQQWLLVFDDITEVVSRAAQRRLGRGGAPAGARDQEPAHADPAERRAAADKLAAKLDAEADRALLDRSRGHHRQAQVQAMKTLVNEFRDYARLPAAQLHPLDLNALVAEVLVLYQDAAGRRAAAARAGTRAAADAGRRHPAAPGHPQPGAERAGRGE
jgi:nitrogen fixation/metabolism regulation signal transduction histidine kinase